MKYQNVRVVCRRRVDDFEFDEVELGADFDPKDDAIEVVRRMKKEALEGLLTGTSQLELPLEEKEESEEERPESQEEEKEVKHNKKKKKQSYTSKKEKEAHEKAEKEKKVKKAKKKKTSKSKSKNTPYDRRNEKHKILLSTTMAEEMGDDWKKVRKESPEKTAAASKAMNGEDFIGSDGEVLDSFVEKFKELME